MLPMRSICVDGPTKTVADGSTARWGRIQQRGNRLRSSALDDLYTTLGLERADLPSEDDVKQAYRAQVKLCHPDLGGQDPEEVARREQLTLELNEAYVTVLQDLQMPMGKRAEPVLDVFDRCVGEPDFGFVNVLEVEVEHVHWFKLQEIFVDECQSDPLVFEDFMRREGIRVNGDTVVRWLTEEQRKQLMVVVEALALEQDVVNVQAQAFWLSDCLRRARKANLI